MSGAWTARGALNVSLVLGAEARGVEEREVDVPSWRPGDPVKVIPDAVTYRAGADQPVGRIDGGCGAQRPHQQRRGAHEALQAGL